MEIKILNTTHDLRKDNPERYYLLFKDVRGNYFIPIFWYIDMYSKDKEDKYLKSFQRVAKISQIKFKKVIDDVILVMKKEEVKGRLLDLIKRLDKASSFDWSNVKKFEKFDKIYVRILDELKEM